MRTDGHFTINILRVVQLKHNITVCYVQKHVFSVGVIVVTMYAPVTIGNKITKT